MGGYVAQQIAVDRPELIRRLILVGTGPRGGDGMCQLAPDVAPLFGTVYDPQDLMWLPIFFSPSDASQAAGHRFLERIRARTEDRDAPVARATVAAHAAAASEWGAAASISEPTVRSSSGDTRSPAAVFAALAVLGLMPRDLGTHRSVAYWMPAAATTSVLGRVVHGRIAWTRAWHFPRRARAPPWPIP
jgi:pimeloyl-ACP methyl ester carboxylesterase